MTLAELIIIEASLKENLDRKKAEVDKTREEFVKRHSIDEGDCWITAMLTDEENKKYEGIKQEFFAAQKAYDVFTAIDWR